MAEREKWRRLNLLAAMEGGNLVAERAKAAMPQFFGGDGRRRFGGGKSKGGDDTLS